MMGFLASLGVSLATCAVAEDVPHEPAQHSGADGGRNSDAPTATFGHRVTIVPAATADWRAEAA